MHHVKIYYKCKKTNYENILGKINNYLNSCYLECKLSFKYIFKFVFLNLMINF